MPFSNDSNTVLDKKKTKRKQLGSIIIVLNDNFNNFQHMVNCLQNKIPSISENRSSQFAIEVDREGSA